MSQTLTWGARWAGPAPVSGFVNLWETEAEREQRVPLRRWGEPDEIVGAAILLASPAGSFITGSVLTVDGGLTTVI